MLPKTRFKKASNGGIEAIKLKGMMMDRYYQTERKEMLCYVPEQAKKILEVGCGEGRFSGQLMKDGRSVWGVEPEEKVAKIAESKLDRVFPCTIEEAFSKLHGEAFDCVIFNDVLEHLLDPWSILRHTAEKLLAPDGIVVASLPNIRHYSIIKQLWQEGDWRYEEEGLLDRTHLRFFTPKTMVELFVSSGFEIVTIEGIKPHKVPFKLKLLSSLAIKNPKELSFIQYAIVAKRSNCQIPLAK